MYKCRGYSVQKIQNMMAVIRIRTENRFLLVFLLVCIYTVYIFTFLANLKTTRDVAKYRQL